MKGTHKGVLRHKTHDASPLPPNTVLQDSLSCYTGHTKRRCTHYTRTDTFRNLKCVISALMKIMVLKSGRPKNDLCYNYMF